MKIKSLLAGLYVLLGTSAVAAPSVVKNDVLNQNLKTSCVTQSSNDIVSLAIALDNLGVMSRGAWDEYAQCTYRHPSGDVTCSDLNEQYLKLVRNQTLVLDALNACALAYKNKLENEHTFTPAGAG